MVTELLMRSFGLADTKPCFGVCPLKGGGVQAFHFGKTYFQLGVEGEGQDTSRHFEGSFGSRRAILPM